MKLHTTRIICIILGLLALTLAFSSRFAAQPPAESSALRVYTSDGFKPALQALIPQIEHSLGRKVSPEFESSKALEQKIESGEPFDVAILSTNVVDELIKSGKVSAGSSTGLGRAGIGVGLRAGAPKPDISTPDAMKRTLLNAKSITFNRDGASAVHIHEMVQRLDIVDQMKPKLMPAVGAGQPQRDVAAGKAQMVITLVPEIADFKELEVVGPLPGDLQSYIDFSAGVSANSKDPEAAKALIKYLTSPTVAHTLKTKGIERK